MKFKSLFGHKYTQLLNPTLPAINMQESCADRYSNLLGGDGEDEGGEERLWSSNLAKSCIFEK